ncbi:hypothetical protein [Spirillospora sp. CA-128828]|uniref:hypothetical protein n=1 Tax=Spirillospora sp. CA-128828 TaxID=3240033 RepID=UPI003D943914
MRCPACHGAKERRHYLCRGCWRALRAPVRAALNRRDAHAGVRLLQLHRQLQQEVPLCEIEVMS